MLAFLGFKRERAELQPPGDLLAFFGLKRGRAVADEAPAADDSAPPAVASARKKRKVATPPAKGQVVTPTTKGRRPRIVPPSHPVGLSRVNMKQVKVEEGWAVLSNEGGRGLAIGGWTLRSGSKTVLTITAGTVLEAMGAILLLAPETQPPAFLQNSGLPSLSSSAAWTDGILLHDGGGVLVDGEGYALSQDAPLQAAVSRAVEYYRTLVSKLVAQRLFAKSPNFVGPSSVNADVRLTHDAREELHRVLVGVADCILSSCKTSDGSVGPPAVCVAVEAGLPACDVQRRALAEAKRAKEHPTLFLLRDAEVRAFAELPLSGGIPLCLPDEAVHTLGVALDYFLAELVETVATMSYVETNAMQGPGEQLPDAELCTGALDRLALLTAVCMDPDMHRIYAAAIIET
ncbi:hypothetical protein T492DRAFT_1144378 [Pavlovales sp. CCMP2436]|nr:hypothetical protein T492DRAFT_1144378 [Pavlovales sp. CCMP2436]